MLATRILKCARIGQLGSSIAECKKRELLSRRHCYSPAIAFYLWTEVFFNLETALYSRVAGNSSDHEKHEKHERRSSQFDDDRTTRLGGRPKRISLDRTHFYFRLCLRGTFSCRSCFSWFKILFLCRPQNKLQWSDNVLPCRRFPA